jgi:ABC-type methionine transport system permease subunit
MEYKLNKWARRHTLIWTYISVLLALSFGACIAVFLDWPISPHFWDSFQSWHYAWPGLAMVGIGVIPFCIFMCVLLPLPPKRSNEKGSL